MGIINEANNEDKDEYLEIKNTKNQIIIKVIPSM